MRILVIQAHPHYAGTMLAGTLFNHTQRGDEVVAVALTNGELMCNLVSPQELAVINEREALASAEVLGIREMRFLAHPDAELVNDHALQLELANQIRDVKPDIVVTHWPHDTHPDFRATGQAAVDATFYALLVSGRWAETLPSHWTSKAYGFEHPGLSLDFKPTTLIDITEAVEAKKRSLGCFKMHIKANFGGDLDRYVSFHLAPNRYWALESGFAQGVLYAEPFSHLPIHEVHNKAVRYLLP